MKRITTAALFACSMFMLHGCSEKAEPVAGGGGDTGTAENKAPRIAFVTNGVASFWVVAKAGATAAGEAFGADVSVYMPADISDQKRILEDLVTKQVDGIAVSPIDPVNQTDQLNDIANETTLITHDSDAPDSDRLVYIGMDNYTAGRMCGDLVREALPDGGKVFIFIGRLEQDNARRRRQGTIDAILGRSVDPTRYDPPNVGELTGDGYTVLGTLTDQFDRSKGKSNAEDVITRHPDLDCMVGLFAYNPPLCLAALEQAGKIGEIKVVAFDEDYETLQGIKDGTVHGTIVQDPYNYGYKSVEVLAAIARGDESVIPDSGFIEFPARVIRKDNVDEFWADLKKKMGEG